MADDEKRNGEKRKDISPALRQTLEHPIFVQLAHESPATAQLIRAALVRFHRLPMVLNPLDVIALEQLARDIVEIFSWIVPPNTEPAQTPGELDLATDMIRRGVLTFPQAMEAAARAETRPRGGPITETRVKALKALDIRQTNSGKPLSFSQLAVKVNYCEETEQPPVSFRQCGERLRKQVGELKDFLRRLSSGEESWH